MFVSVWENWFEGDREMKEDCSPMSSLPHKRPSSITEYRRPYAEITCDHECSSAAASTPTDPIAEVREDADEGSTLLVAQSARTAGFLPVRDCRKIISVHGNREKRPRVSRPSDIKYVTIL